MNSSNNEISSLTFYKSKRSPTITALQIRILLSLIILCFGLFNNAKAQLTSPKDRFEVNIAKGCAPLTVTATNISIFDPAQVPIVWNMDWDGDESSIEVDPSQTAEQATFTYTEPGVYQILQVVGNQSDPIDTLTIEVMEARAPQFEVYNCINNTVYIDFSNEDYYDQLFFDFGDGGIQTVSTNQQSISYQYFEQGEYTIFAEGLFDDADPNCGTVDTTIVTVENLDIATLSQVLVVGEQEIQIAYNLADPNVSYRLEVAENGSGNFNVAAIDLEGNSTAFTWNDPNINTRDNYYCFRLVAVNRCDETLNQFTETVCSIALQASAENLQNQLSWQSEGFASYQLSRDDVQLSNANNTSYTDTDVVCQEIYHYNVTAELNGVSSISYTEAITAISTNIPQAPTDLEATLQGTGVLIDWPAIDGAELYYIYRSNDGSTPQLFDSLVQTPSTYLTYTDPEELTVDLEYCYQISYLDECGNESELSEELCIQLPRQARVFFPNAFTPDGDGLNDIFIYKADLLESVQFQVYNRWGELLFSTTSLDEGWDGTYKNGLAPQGTYIYMLDVVDQLGNSFSKSGKFTLLKASP